MTANNEITLEVCTNNEAIREYCGLSFGYIEDGMEREAADFFCDELMGRLQAAGYEVTRAAGHRSLCHGWNGANTFTHKAGAVGTFDTLTAEQESEIDRLQDEAAEAMQAAFAAA